MPRKPAGIPHPEAADDMGDTALKEADARGESECADIWRKGRARAEDGKDGLNAKDRQRVAAWLRWFYGRSHIVGSIPNALVEVLAHICDPRQGHGSHRRAMGEQWQKAISLEAAAPPDPIDPTSEDAAPSSLSEYALATGAFGDAFESGGAVGPDDHRKTLRGWRTNPEYRAAVEAARAERYRLDPAAKGEERRTALKAHLTASLKKPPARA